MSDIENSSSFCLKTRILISLESNHFLLKRPCGAVQLLGEPAAPRKGVAPKECVCAPLKLGIHLPFYKRAFPYLQCTGYFEANSGQIAHCIGWYGQ